MKDKNKYGLSDEELQYLEHKFYIYKSCLTLHPIVSMFLNSKTKDERKDAIMKLVEWERENVVD